MQTWKQNRTFYQIPKEEKKKHLFQPNLNHKKEIKKNNYIQHLKRTLPQLSFTEPCGSIGLLACSHIYSVVRDQQPNIVVETGIGRGVITIFILSAIQKNGHGKLISVDKGNEIRALIYNGLKMNWDFRDGKPSDVLPTITESIDIFLHDSLHTYKNMMFEFECVYPYIKEGGLIMSHDIGTNNSFFDFAKKIGREVQYIQTTKNRYGIGVITK